MSIKQLDEARSQTDSGLMPYVPAQAKIDAARLGRPTLYRSEFCQDILNDAALGHTFGATAALIGVTRSTLHDWAAIHPEFAEALDRAKGIRQRFYEGYLIDLVRRGGDSTRFSAIKFGLINVGADDWKEKLSAESSQPFSLAELIRESITIVDSRTIDATPSVDADPVGERCDPVDPRRPCPIVQPSQ